MDDARITEALSADRLMKKIKFAKILEENVDFTKVNLDVMSKWVTEKITELLGFEDEIVISLVVNSLSSEVPTPVHPCRATCSLPMLISGHPGPKAAAT